MNQTKIQLSPSELQLVKNADWILTKNQIIEKVMDLFGELATINYGQWQAKAPFFPSEILDSPPKISKGEKYQGLPYVVLDYPRFFKKEHVFAQRTFFWWGNYFSLTLHLKGRYKELFEESLIGLYEPLVQKDYRLGIGEDEWIHHFDSENYLPVNEFSSKEFSYRVKSHRFLKLSCMLPLDGWNQSEEFLSVAAKDWVNWLGG